jgi:hypothetical protein
MDKNVEKRTIVHTIWGELIKLYWRQAEGVPTVSQIPNKVTVLEIHM